MTKTEPWTTAASGCSHDGSRPLDEASADVTRRFCRMIRASWRAWLTGLVLALAITLVAGNSARADNQSSGPNTNALNQFLAELSGNPSTINSSSVPKCSSPAGAPSPFRILDNQTYALCAVASCFVFDGVAYCKCEVKTGDSISAAFEYDDGQNVCTVNEAGAANGYMVSTFSPPTSVSPGGEQASYTCPGGSDGAYAQCDGGICFKSTQGKSFPGFNEPLAEDEIICSCPITEQSPKQPVGYQIVGPYPCQEAFFENCKRKAANKKTGSTLYVGAPTGTGDLLAFLLTGMVPPSNKCTLPRN